MLRKLAEVYHWFDNMNKATITWVSWRQSLKTDSDTKLAKLPDVNETVANHLYSPTYFFSNSPVKWRLTNVVFPVPPSPTKTSCSKQKIYIHFHNPNETTKEILLNTKKNVRNYYQLAKYSYLKQSRCTAICPRATHTDWTVCCTLLTYTKTSVINTERAESQHTMISRRNLFQMEPTLKVATGSCCVIVASFRLSGVRRDKIHQTCNINTFTQTPNSLQTTLASCSH